MALKNIFLGHVKPIDLGLVNERPFTIMAAAGLFSNIIENIKREEKSLFGFWTYFLRGLEQLYSAKEYTFKITIDEKKIDTKSIGVFVSNASNFLGAFPTITPNTDPTDGYLNLFIISLKGLKKEPLKYLKYFSSYITNNLKNEELFKTFKGKNITISSTSALKIQADGCIVSETPAQIKILPGKLKLLVPKRLP